MRGLSAREKSVLAGGVIVAVLFGYLLVLLLPTQRAAATTERARNRLQEQLAESERMYREAVAAKAELPALHAQLGAVYFPSPELQSGAIREIEQLTKELNITLTSIRPGEVETKDGSTKQPLAIKVESDLGRIAQLLYDLEKPERRLWVEGIEITSAKQTGDTLAVTVYLAVFSPARESGADDA